MFCFHYRDKVRKQCRFDTNTPSSWKLRSGRVTPNEPRFEGRLYAHILQRFTTLGMDTRWNSRCTSFDLKTYSEDIAETLRDLLTSPLCKEKTKKILPRPKSFSFVLKFW